MITGNQVQVQRSEQMALLLLQRERVIHEVIFYIAFAYCSFITFEILILLGVDMQSFQWLNTSQGVFVFRALSLCTVFLAMRCAGKCWHISATVKLRNMSFSFVEMLAWIAFLIGFTFVSLPPGYWLIPHVLLCFTMTDLDFIVEKMRKETIKEHKARAQGQQTPFEHSVAESVKVVPHCEICGKESIYDLCLGCEKQWQTERQRVRNQILRAKQANTPATLTLKEWLDTLNTYNWCCAYCYGEYECLEHYVPIALGGGTTQENCVPSCYRCNTKKSGNHPERSKRSTYRTFQTSPSVDTLPVPRGTPRRNTRKLESEI